MQLSGSGYVIRRVSAEDRLQIVGIIERCGNINEEEKRCAVELLDIYLNNADQKDYIFEAAYADGRVGGYVCYGRTPFTASTYDLYWIIVDKDQQGRGVGGALLKHMESGILKSGSAMIVAETSGTAQYEHTREFYRRSGFVKEAAIKDFYRPGDDLNVYVKRLEYIP